MTRTDAQLEQWFIDCFKECDTIDVMEDPDKAVEALCELPPNQLLRCCEMAKEAIS